MKRNLIVSGILLVLMIVSACLKSVWAGFIYFAMSFLILLCIYWLANMIIHYLEDYYYSFEEEFKEYRAEIINSSLLSSQEFDQNKEEYIKKYKKSLRKYKFIDISKMIFVLMVIVICIIAMARGKF